MQSSPKQTILVVDDEHNIADTTAEILRLFGYGTLCAYNAEDAMSVALKEKPTLVLSDVMLPHMNGVELAIELQHQQPKCKVVLFSGNSGSAPLLDQARADGYDFDILPKPLHPHELVKHLAMRLSA